MTFTPDLWDAAWLPRAPLATDDLSLGVRRENRPTARTRRYVEASPRALLSMLVVDVDHEDALLKSFWRPAVHPDPSWVSINPENGHGHVGWVLETPVCRTDSARIEPMKFAARVEAGLTHALDGDAGYAGLLTKNPLHEHWETFWGPETPYTLGQLAEGLGDLFPRSLPRKAAENSGLGRNVALFNRVRQWAYPAISRYWTDHATIWEETTLAYALNVNAEFAVPLDHNEVTHLARSVARWTRRNITPEQTARNRASWASIENQTRRSARAAQKRTFSRQQAREILR
ncbi:hypothetical protein B7R22_18480 [Subtercola boreus]|uniref:Primase C-terminal 1 domain-containing protein n=1 Tax=Subtercola boreus TaxID=120213 RepID=A0A3E0VPS6_9MICO|nr:replication initiation protein [Subtercola boreus]RFA11665.1 hypothetical protein B7R22_18480 [Subtercola boreus]